MCRVEKEQVIPAPGYNPQVVLWSDSSELWAKLSVASLLKEDMIPIHLFFKSDLGTLRAVAQQ